MSMSDSRARLAQATKKLKSDWRQTQETWLDDNCLQFEKLVMDPLEGEVNSIDAAPLACVGAAVLDIGQSVFAATVTLRKH